MNESAFLDLFRSLLPNMSDHLLETINFDIGVESQERDDRDAAELSDGPLSEPIPF